MLIVKELPRWPRALKGARRLRPGRAAGRANARPRQAVTPAKRRAPFKALGKRGNQG